MEEAERIGRSKSRGESTPEGNNNPGENDDGEK